MFKVNVVESTTLTLNNVDKAPLTAGPQLSISYDSDSVKVAASQPVGGINIRKMHPFVSPRVTLLVTPPRIILLLLLVAKASIQAEGGIVIF